MRRLSSLFVSASLVLSVGCSSDGGGAAADDSGSSGLDGDVSDVGGGPDGTLPDGGRLPDVPDTRLPDDTIGIDTLGIDTFVPPTDSGPVIAPEPLSPNIVVDQIGYRPSAEKIAVLRSPQKGFDVATTYTPGAKYAVVDAHTSAKVFEGAATPWNGGATDGSSGDKAWWFDFSSVVTPGDYFVLDETASVRSDIFTIGDRVYRDALGQSVCMFYYQRDGFAKDAAHAGTPWVDTAAHMGAGQDTACKLYSDGSAARDVHGGWWDAGDQNKYTNWGAGDVIELLRAFTEAPTAFFDDTNIPESGNGVADVLDETKFELDWLVRMQGADGSVLSIVGNQGAKDPSFGGTKDTRASTDTAPCKYGPASTSASLSTAAAFAYASIVFKSAPGATTAYAGYADDLLARAKKAWDWAIAHPSVTFSNGGKVGAGEQETDDKGRTMMKLRAAVFLYEATSDAKYRDLVDAGYKSVNMISSGYVDCFATEDQETLLEYAKTTGATAAVAADIKAKYKAGAASGHNLGAVKTNPDPYGAYLYVYTWGSNQVKAAQGNLLYDVLTYGVDSGASGDAIKGAERFVHYMHGVNPLSLVYLSNMGDHGAAKSVTRFYHSWFTKGSDWDAVGVSKYGPPPGYLVGGPNPSYSWDGCCPSGCSGVSCGSSPPTPPTGQPDQKAYKDFNDSWPLDSWAISEPDDGYQAKWVRLLSKFVK